MSSTGQYESGLHPVASPASNDKYGVQVQSPPGTTDDKPGPLYGGLQMQSYPGTTSDYPWTVGQAPAATMGPAEPRWFGMRRSTAILTAAVLVLLAGIVTVGALFGAKIGELEKKLAATPTIPPTTTIPDENGTPTQVTVSPSSTVTDIAVGGYSYYGCYVDALDRALPDAEETSDTTMTNQRCASFCKDYRYFGTEHGTQCYCGDEKPEKSASPWHCTEHCSGAQESAENCGGFFYLSVWESDD